MSFGTIGYSGFTGAKAAVPGPATTVPISGLLAANATNSINNAALSQTWNWANLNGNDGLLLQLNSTAGYTGNNSIDHALLNIYSTGTTNGTGLFVNLPVKIKNDATGSGLVTNYGLAIEVAGAGNNYALRLVDGSEENGYVLTCDSFGNAFWAAAAGTIGGSGTVNQLAKFTPTGVAIGNSLISDNGTSLTSTGDLNFTAKEIIFNPTAASEIMRITRPTAYSGGMNYVTRIANVSNGDGTYNSPVISGFNPYGTQDPTQGGNYTSMEPDYRPGGALYKEYHYEIYHPNGPVYSRLFSSTYVQRSTLALSSNQWDFRGNSTAFYTLSNGQYASIGGDDTGAWSTSFFASTGVSGIKFQAAAAVAITYVDSLPSSQELNFRNWSLTRLSDNIYTKNITSSSANGIYISNGLNIVRNGTNSRLNFNYDGVTDNKAYIDVDYGSGEIRHYASNGGYFQTFYNNNAQAFRTISGGIAGSSSASGNLTISSTSDATKGKILFGTSAYDEVNNRLGLGTASPGATLDVTGKFQTSGVNTLSNLAGTGSRAVLADATGVLSAPVSDRSVKKNIVPINYGIDTIMQLKPVCFQYKKAWDKYGKGEQIGFIAQDIQQVLPGITFTTPSTNKMGYNATDLIPVLVKAIQEQQIEIETLKQLLKKQN